MTKTFSVITDTATVVVFDLAAMKHRLSDTPDWWSIREDELHETNQGNIAFFNVGQDGKYDIAIVQDIADEDGEVYIGFPSGKVFIGAGEDTTGGDLEPDGSESIQGDILEFTPGNYKVKYKKDGGKVFLSFLTSESKNNNFFDPIRI
ncbi:MULTISPECIES: DUF6386 family protein [unclassified Pseudomonas]|uniref:DUF6386 family protein n=1 Tax=unclassified Pseudomonas TaxID=196821 RepID=UPI000D3BA31F|nr:MULTISPECIES: DUF6386 family protein [unclassified Pseudomonas]RAU47874.1 hypothetical protein DBP26_004770 [Pseudomonas sp. RIT 409]RAU55432.1 hypothetical protein DBY65_005895 [Pseudomonas sp. RIT 412]